MSRIIFIYILTAEVEGSGGIKVMHFQAYNLAVGEVDNLNEELFKDSVMILQLLRDNLKLWNSENKDDDIKKLSPFSKN